MLLSTQLLFTMLPLTMLPLTLLPSPMCPQMARGEDWEEEMGAAERETGLHNAFL